MSQQFLRTCSLSIGSGSPVVTGGGPNQLRVQFAVESRVSQGPAQAQIMITNASPSTAAKLQKEHTTLTLSAGYESNSGPIFTGQIIETQYGEKVDDFTNTLLRIWCAGWDDAYNQAKVSTTLAAGSTPQNIVDTCLTAMAPYGVTMGQLAGVDLSTPAFPRGVTLAGMARDFLREVALSKGATHTVNNGKLDIVAKNASVQSSGIVISAATGMLGQPILRQDGVIVRCRINPALQVNTAVTVQANIISPNFELGSDLTGTLNTDTVADYQNRLSSTGQYRVLHLKTNGDSRGGPWETELTLLAQGTAPNAAQLQAGLGYS